MDTAKAIQDLKINLSLWNKIPSIVLSLMFIGLPLFLGWVFLFIKPEHQATPQDNMPYPLAIFGVSSIVVIALIGVFNLYKIKDYTKLTPVYSNVSKGLKIRAIESIAQQFGYSPIETYDPFYLKYWYNVPFSLDLDIIILIDDYGFYINVTDYAKISPFMIIRFRNITRKIKDEIEKKLAKS